MCDKPVATFYGWMPNGVKTTIPVPLDGTAEDFDRILNYQNIFLSRGFVLDDPAYGKLEAGEKREKINGILRRKDQKNGDNTTSPTFDLYPDNPALGRRCLIVNLDTPEETAEFEKVTGYKVSDFKVCLADQLNRKEDPATYAEYAKPIRGNVSVVFKDNPAYDPNAAKKKRQHFFVRWEVANATPTPQPLSQPATPPAASGKASEPDYAALEIEERKKAVTALDNEAVTLFKVHYNALHNGQGNPRWDGMVRVGDGATVPVVLWTEHVNLLKQAGHDVPRDSDNLEITVITEVMGGERRIKGVEALDGTWMYLSDKKPANANVGANSGNSDTPAWIYDRVKLLYQLSQRCPKITPQERAATADKMHRENEFDKVGSLEGAVELVVNRLATHKKEKVPA